MGVYQCYSGSPMTVQCLVEREMHTPLIIDYLSATTT